MTRGKERLLRELRARVQAAGSQAAAARALGVHVMDVSHVLLGKREPAGKLLKAMGWVRVVDYAREP
jgi:hypothetical protein